MNLQQIAAKHKVSENFLQSREDALNISAASIDDLVFEIKKGNIDSEKLIYKLSQLKTFMVDVRNSSV